MPKCFVIQPFDGAKYDKRYNDIFKPAIESAGLEAYRVDQDPTADIPIETIEKNISESDVCFAEISEDNPNVWYELGYAYAKGKGVCLVRSTECSNSFPFDVRHKNIITYESDSSSDFNALNDSIVQRLKALLERKTKSAKLSNLPPAVVTEGLTPHESSALINLGESLLNPEGVPQYQFIEYMERSGFTRIAGQLAAKSLLMKGFIEQKESADYNGNEYYALCLTDTGSMWLLQNQDKFQLTSEYQEPDDNDIPF